MARLGIRLVEKRVPHVRGAWPADIPVSHRIRHFLGFPSFVIYDSNAWDEATRNPRAYQLNGVIYNGRIGPEGKAIETTPALPHTAESIARWAAPYAGRPAVVAPVAPQAASVYANNCANLVYVNPGSRHQF